jgi:ABC-type nitrate/sulfonate/bicarbonate transport system substrate-binding protein
MIVADEQHFWEKRGISVEADIAANSDALRVGIEEGPYDIGHAAVDNAIALAEQAHSDVVVVVGGEGSTNELIAQPEFKEIKQLKGKMLIVDAPATAYAIQLKAMLSSNGLHDGFDYDLKPVGPTPARLAAMREHKEYAASILGPPASLIAKQAGFVSLGTTQMWIGAYQGIGGFVHRSWGNSHRAELESYIAALIEGQRWLIAPENKPQVLALLQREYKLSEALASKAYDAWIVAPGGLQPDMKVDLEGLQNVVKLREQVEHTWKGAIPSVNKFYDPSFYEAAAREAQ